VRPIIAVLTVIALLAAASTADARALARNCNGYILAPGDAAGVTIHRGAVPCRTAKRVLRTYLNSDARCEGSACVRKHSGWTCASACPAIYPKLASCNRGRTVIAAYAIND